MGAGGLSGVMEMGVPGVWRISSQGGWYGARSGGCHRGRLRPCSAGVGPDRRPSQMIFTWVTRRVFVSGLFTSALLPPAPSVAPPANLPSKLLTLNSGNAMPLIGLGTWEAAPGEVGAAVQAAIRAGCRHIDCAAAYRNEREVGDALRASGVLRSNIFITSKLWNDRRRPEDVRAALEQTLLDLGTEYVDLYLIHWPVVWARDSVMKPDRSASLLEAWRTLEALVDEGKCRSIGVSNYKQSELDELLAYARIPPAVNQIELHPRLPQRALVEYCQSKGIAVTAEVHSVSAAAVLLRWNVQRNVAVIPKSSNPQRVTQNAQEPWTFKLSESEIAELDGLEDGSRSCTAPWSTFDDRTVSDRLLTGLLTGLARGVFSVGSLDITRR
mmetsp:Transcript_41555/g.130600  ORF Transcript_41555/g.130600 Transcript_41555/m.130600 type:complete len:384 (-) Transcript_41555:76-1227(-)